MSARGIDVETDRDANDEVTRVRVRFGPHHVVEIVQAGNRVTFELACTHHGFRADASEVPSELERLIDAVRAARPETSVD